MSRVKSPLYREKLWEQIKYKPHGPEQLQFHDSEARFRTAVCGRRFGKSMMASIDLVEACFIPDSYYWIAGPTYKLAEKEFRNVYNAFHDKRKLGLGAKLKSTYNAKQGDMKITFPWNTVVECVSATNPDSLLGEGLDGVIMSEAAEHTLETWQKYIEPALSDKLGWATFPTTPKGFNWIHAMYQLGQHPDKPDYDSWHYPSWLNTYRYPGGFNENCHIIRNKKKVFHVPGYCRCNPELVRIWTQASPGYWGQMYAARFTNVEGSIYSEFSEQDHIKDIAYNPMWRNYWVFDWGFSAPFVCLDIMVDPEDNVYVWREYQRSQLSTWEHAHILKERDNPPGFHCDAMFGDPAGADAIATIALVLGQVFSEPVTWDIGIESVKRGLKLQPNGLPKLFIDRSCVDLIRQMQALRRKPEKEGQNIKEGQVDYDDHGPDALRYFYSQFFVLGGGASLSDVYDRGTRSESQTYFSSQMNITLDTHVGYD